jgi:hypothetical protein
VVLLQALKTSPRAFSRPVMRRLITFAYDCAGESDDSVRDFGQDEKTSKRFLVFEGQIDVMEDLVSVGACCAIARCAKVMRGRVC